MASTNDNNNSSNNSAKQNPLSLNFPSGAQPDISKCIKREQNEIKKSWNLTIIIIICSPCKPKRRLLSYYITGTNVNCLSTISR